VKMTGGFIKLTEACRIRNDFANFDKTVQWRAFRLATIRLS
jgi:hypothetical protein